MKLSQITFLILFFFQCFQVHSQSACGNYKVKLYTHWFSGWNGHSLAIKINNNVVYSNVGESWISGHVPFEFDFPVQSNDVISIYFKRNGNGWADNCKYEVYDNNNNLIVTRDGAGSGSSGGPENIYGLLACSSASKCGTFTVELIDGYGGNGWGNSSLDIFINNSLYVSGTHQDLSYAWADAEDISFAVEANDKIDIIYNASATQFDYYYDAYKVFDTQGNLIRVVSNQGDSIPLGNSQRIFACPNYVEPRPNLTVSPIDKYFKNSFRNSSSATIKSIRDMIVCPNPTKELSSINFNILEESDVTIQVKNISGKIVQTNFYPNILGQQVIEIDVKDLNNGLYFVNLCANGEITSKKLTVSK